MTREEATAWAQSLGHEPSPWFSVGGDGGECEESYCTICPGYMEDHVCVLGDGGYPDGPHGTLLKYTCAVLQGG